MLRFDEVVAANVRRIREEQGLSVAELAKKLGLGRHVVYDFERPRQGAAQRAFLWSEIVTLCAVLDVTIFELVLPPEGHRTVPAGWEHLPLVIPDAVETQGSPLMKAHWRRDDRGMLLDVLIGPGMELNIDLLTSLRDEREERLIDELKTLLSEKGKNQ